jgi:peroxiredoxin family protein
MTSLAVMVSGGSTNNLIQVLTLLMAAVHSDIKTRVFFRDESLLRLMPSTINEPAFAPSYGDATAGGPLHQRLKKLDLLDLHKLCRDIKASGDVKYYACSSSMAICGLRREDLIPEIDEVRGLPTFLLEDVAVADRVLTF